MSSPSILIVDDVPVMRTLLRNILNAMGSFEFVDAASGTEAIEKIRAERFDIVFLDIDMPGMDGLETLKNIKNINGDIFVVMVTAYSDADLLNASLNAGADGYVVKTYTPSKVEQMLKKFWQQCPPLREVPTAPAAG